MGEFRSQVQMSKQGGQQWQWLGHEQKWRNHDIRRTVATWLNEAGANTWVVEHLLGHAVAGWRAFIIVRSIWMKRRRR